MGKLSDQDEILTQSEREREKSVGERVLVCSWSQEREMGKDTEESSSQRQLSEEPYVCLSICVCHSVIGWKKPVGGVVLLQAVVKYIKKMTLQHSEGKNGLIKKRYWIN